MDTAYFALIILLFGLFVAITTLAAIFAMLCLAFLRFSRITPFPGKQHTASTRGGLDDTIALIGRARYELETSRARLDAVLNYASRTANEVSRGPNAYDADQPSRWERFVGDIKRDD